MSTRFIPTKPTLRQQKLQWMNMIAHIHDQKCDCNNPMEHTCMLIFEEEPNLKFNAPEKDLIKKCITGETTIVENGDQEPDGIGEGELDALFKEDFTEEENTG